MKLPMLLPVSLPAKLPAFPRPLARVLARLPAWPATHAFVAACNLVAWPSLSALDWYFAEGKRFGVVVKDMGIRLTFAVTPRGFRAESGEADVTFTATAEDFARLALRREDPDTLFFNRRLLIEGDTNLGLTVKNLLDGVELEAVAAAMPVGMGRVVMHLNRR